MKDLYSILESYLLEDKVVKFDGEMFPKDGWVVIMCGGPGSGKSTALNNQIAIDGKVMDVDKFKKQYLNAQANRDRYSLADDDEYEYNMKNPSDISKLHMKIKDLKWKEKQRSAFIKGQGQHLSNVIFDMTGSKEKEILEVVSMIEESGLPYKIAIVWVVCNRSVAMYRNIYRGKIGDRMLSDEVLHNKHNDVNRTMQNVMGLKDNFDEMWIISSSYQSLKEDVRKNKKERFVNAYNIKKDTRILKNLKSLLGPEEPTPSNPSVYLSQEECLHIDGAEDIEQAVENMGNHENLLK